MAARLNEPREIEVLADVSGEPVALVRNGRRSAVTAVRNAWRVDDEWWRDEISRLYFEVELKDGLVSTVFQDLLSGKWYQQKY
ncbi:MAG: hypothetical protein IBX68_06570 [Dehalococcoidia bacterium]|nr:hypothetical protein [Dehalococcoidia bacterium]